MSVERQCDRSKALSFVNKVLDYKCMAIVPLPCYWYRHGYCRIGAVINQDFGYCFPSPPAHQAHQAPFR